MDRIKKLAETSVTTALSKGAETAEVAVRESTDFEVTVRKGRIETLTEAVSSRIAITLSLDRKRASVTSSDLSANSINGLITEAVELAGFMDRDGYFAMPENGELGRVKTDLELFDPEAVELPTDRKIQLAMDLERAACGMDKRIIPNGASFSDSVVTNVFANNLGFCDGYRKTYSSIDISCAAEDRPERGDNSGKKQSSYWFSTAVRFNDLEPVEEVARRAVDRTIRKLGAVKPRTCKVPVVFDPLTAGMLLSYIASAVNGENIYKKSSFLVDMTGTQIATPAVTIIDDSLLPGKLGTRPFDSEGVRTRTNVVIDRGVLKSYLMDSYQARKLGARTTGNAGGVSNFYLVPGTAGPGEIISSINEGLYLTSISGPGANWTTGDFSQGGQGIWIEGGKLSYPVSEFTITGTFQQMFGDIEMIGNNLTWRTSITAPTLKIARMTISGT